MPLEVTWWTLSTRLRIWRLGVRIPRGAPPSPQLSGPVTGPLLVVGPRDCDQTATTSTGTRNPTATTCDHDRQSWLRYCWSAGAEAPTGGRRGRCDRQPAGTPAVEAQRALARRQ